MKIRILAIGKLKRGPLTELVNEYRKRCQWFIEILEIDHGPKATEAKDLMERITDEDYVILLDETGTGFSSQRFSEKLENLQNLGTSRVTFVIGGALGVEEIIKERADLILAFGEQTWPHMLTRVMLVEQIYRAEQILKGHPYHKE